MRAPQLKRVSSRQYVSHSGNHVAKTVLYKTRGACFRTAPVACCMGARHGGAGGAGEERNVLRRRHAPRSLPLLEERGAVGAKPACVEMGLKSRWAGSRDPARAAVAPWAGGVSRRRQ